MIQIQQLVITRDENVHLDSGQLGYDK